MTCTSLAMLAALFSGAGPLYIGTERM